MQRRAIWSSILFLSAMAAANCDTSKEPDDAPASEAPDDGMPDCTLGSLACECTAGGACDPGLTCVMGYCVPADQGCPTGSLGCACTDGGACDPGLVCLNDVCIEAAGDDDDDGGDDDDDDDDDVGDDDDDVGDDDDDDDDDDVGDDDDDDDDDDPNACVPGVGDCEDGFKCQPYVKEDGACCVDADTCVPITGDRQYGESCTRERYGDDCAKDLFCFAGTSGKEGPGECKQLCDGLNPDSCPDLGSTGWQCVPFNSGKLPMCERSCHPLRPNCDDGDGCYWAGSLYMCATPDIPPGGGDDGDDCYTVQSCKPGLACLEGASLEGCTTDYCCTTFCDINGDDSCSGDEECVQSHDPGDSEVDPDWLDIGWCMLGE